MFFHMDASCLFFIKYIVLYFKQICWDLILTLDVTNAVIMVDNGAVSCS